MARKIEFIDLEGQIEYVQERYAFYWAALRSSQLNKACRCVEENGTSLSSCRKCFGTGHLFVDKLVKLQRARSSSGIDLLAEAGKINTSSVRFIIEKGVKPKNTDWVLELDLDETTGSPRQPISITRAFKIQSVHPCRGKKGGVSFWYCLTEEKNFEIGSPIVE